MTTYSRPSTMYGERLPIAERGSSVTSGSGMQATLGT
ncbi:hypothetical protein NB689_003323 [Xanthomonas sacchari]|nr:hypothetical protein [Xanthomonas sacchari]MCW0425218.1 hypothetical protein [Xanthomonas sacchari]MCW0438772.1 hypothetical protein [Xanthomonas sacchari]MCW0450716.1 hypothetical protein [Xanthomonas sacchari]MCW0454339.1 hypothetical protein [Xanthomonas sacchari]